MERTFLKVLVVAVVAGPLAALAVSVAADSHPNYETAPTLTITSRSADAMSAAPGLRFTSFDADGCAFMSHAVIDEKGRVRTVNDLFCKH